MSMGILAPLLEAIKGQDKGPHEGPTALATVTDIANNLGGALVQFDGETSASTRRYKMLCNAMVAERVVMLRVGSTWVVLSAIRNTPPIQAGNNVVTTNGSGVGSFTFPEPFDAAPVVAASGGNGENVSIIGTTTSGFTATFWHPTGYSLNSLSVRCLWIAHPPT
jgi:hypothetical protein